MNNLKELRLSTGKTQKELAIELNLTKSTYNYWENGKIEIDYNSLNMFADFYNVSIDYILGREKRINESKNSTPLTKREQQLLNIFRKCDKGEQSRILGYSESLLKK